MKQSDAGRGASSGQDPLEQLGSVSPGDVVEFWMESPYVVRTVFQCLETIDERGFEWRWMFLDDGSLVEASATANYRYRRHDVVRQGTALYEDIAAADGALARFEERVREGASGRRPVTVEIGGAAYRVTSTGTVGVRSLGEEPGLLPWRSFSPVPQENVYFVLAETADEGNLAVGLWTAHICLSFGRELQPSDVAAVYRK